MGTEVLTGGTKSMAVANAWWKRLTEREVRFIETDWRLGPTEAQEGPVKPKSWCKGRGERARLLSDRKMSTLKTPRDSDIELYAW
jgi:hypothetical protein